MPLAPVDDKGTYLLYQDSGAPADSTSYVTLVAFHGTVFHSGNFQPMFIRASEHKMRMVLVTLRDYPGSTPYSPAEIDAIFSQDAERQGEYMQARGLEISAFLSWLISKEKLPPITQDNGNTSGGIALLGWSTGSAIPFSLVAHADKLSADIRDLLGAYLRTCFLWDPPTYAVGCPLPSLEEFYCPVRDPALSPEEIAEIFPTWVSSYFSHDPATLNSIDDLTITKLITGLSAQSLSDPPPHQLPTAQTMTPEQYNDNIDLLGAMRSHVPFLFIDRTVFESNARRALQERIIWPHLRMALVWFDMSVGDTVMGAWYIKQLVKQADNGRDFSARRMDGSNHFPHWSEPRRCLEVVSELL
ncbi:hypothetical protein OBBRIDRAFT_506278 [Obba rivulosa]|uniref:AB hydrolase-1 domain-containing protein n=1 Tax=Obba rivulosa TaxID=1052685 RepID=A0A8E2AVI6_9APHY|nr:hypothetical protein OBBRIDRAFT_506278 [Obba rivulosa]